MLIKLLATGAKAPVRSTEEAAGYDIFCNGHYVIQPNARALIGTGFAMAIPFGMVGLIWPRSGLAAKFALDTLAGVVDSDYRGEVKVSLFNHGDELVEFKPGDRIAQMLVQPVYQREVILMNELPETMRGNGGFGSTGR
jgi:dUTP pyrophosphatase